MRDDGKDRTRKVQGSLGCGRTAEGRENWGGCKRRARTRWEYASIEGDLEGVREGFERTCGDAQSLREMWVGSREAWEDAIVEGGCERRGRTASGVREG